MGMDSIEVTAHTKNLLTQKAQDCRQLLIGQKQCWSSVAQNNDSVETGYKIQATTLKRFFKRKANPRSLGLAVSAGDL